MKDLICLENIIKTYGGKNTLEKMRNMKDKYVYNVDMDNKKVAKISISKSLSTKEVEDMFNRILLYIKIKKDEDTKGMIEIPDVETCEQWR